MWQSESYGEILYRLRKTKQAWRSISVTEGMLTFLLILVGVLLVLVVLESLLHFAAWMRACLFGALLVAVIAAAIRFIFKPILAVRSDEEVALKVESAIPQAHNLLINSVRLGKDTVAQQRSMVAEVMAEAALGARAFDFDSSLDRRRCVKRGVTLAVCVLAMAVFFAVSPLRFKNALQRILAPGADIPAMGRVALERVEPGDCELLSGSDLVIRATIAGGSSEEFEGFVFFMPEEGRAREFPLSPEDGAMYTYTYPCVRSTLKYRVEIGGTQSKTYSVSIVRLPAVKSLELIYRFPRYTQLPVLQAPNSDGTIQAVKGTEVQINVEATKEILKGWMEVTGGKTLPLSAGKSPTMLTGTLPVDRDYGYKIFLMDTSGHTSDSPVERMVTALPDGKPTVTIQEPGKDTEAALGGKMTLVVRGTDDFGIARARLMMQREKTAEEKEVAHWENFPDPRNATLTYDWLFRKEEFKAGDEVTYWVEMTDACPPEANKGASDKFLVKLKDMEQERREQAEKYKLWEKKLQEVLKQQREARQAAGRLVGPAVGGAQK